jgi:hypothetical protein
MPSATTTTAPRLPAQRSRRARQCAPVVPLGSLTQQGLTGAACSSCGSLQVTRLAMTLTDGTPVTFISCHRCETRRWEHQGCELSVDSVLDRTRKIA